MNEDTPMEFKWSEFGHTVSCVNLSRCLLTMGAVSPNTVMPVPTKLERGLLIPKTEKSVEFNVPFGTKYAMGYNAQQVTQFIDYSHKYDYVFVDPEITAYLTLQWKNEMRILNLVFPAILKPPTYDDVVKYDKLNRTCRYVGDLTKGIAFVVDRILMD